MKTFTTIIFFVIPFWCASQTTVIETVVPNVGSLNKYSLYELSIRLSNDFDNPYDPDEVDLYVEFISPSGKLTRINSFYYENFIRSFDGSIAIDERNPFHVENFQPYPKNKQEKCWKVRFTPTECGLYRYKVYLKVPLQPLQYFPKNKYNEFYVFDYLNNKGYISSKDKRYFAYDRGDLYFPIGLNQPSSSDINGQYRRKTYGSYEFEAKFAKYKENGLNFCRIWGDDIHFNLVGYNPYNYSNPVSGFSNFNQMHAKRLDTILDLAENNGIALQFCLNSGYPLIDIEGCGLWSGNWPDNGIIQHFHWYNPFNELYNGPCKSPLDYFDITNIRNIKLQKDIIRYIIARWGYSTSIFAWELFNEVNQVDIGYIRVENGQYFEEKNIFKNNHELIYPQIVKWHKFLYDYIKSIDPKHLITTSLAYLDDKGYGTKEQYDEIFNKMDIVQAHMYGSYIKKYSDPSQDWSFQEYILNLYDDPFLHGHSIHRHLKDYKDKPFLPGEYGIEGLEINWEGKIFEGTGYLVQDPKNPDYWMNFDPNGYELHNNLWLSVFSGCSGTAMEWFRDYIDDRLDMHKYNVNDGYYHTELYHRYKPISMFINQYPIFDDSFTPDFLTDSKNAINCYYLASSEKNVITGWLQSELYEGKELFKFNDFPSNNKYIYTLSEEKPFLDVSNKTIYLPVSKFGNYRIKLHRSADDFDLIDEQVVLSCGNQLKIQIPRELEYSNFGDAIFYSYYDCNIPYWFDSGFSSEFESINNVGNSIVAWGSKLFYCTINNNLREVFFDGHEWINSGLNTYFESHPHISGDLTIWEDKLFYVSIYNTLREVYYDENGWHDSGLNSFFENNCVVERDLVVWNNKLFYISTTNTLREVYHDENGWHDSGLNSFFETNHVVERDLVVWNNKLFYISTTNTLREVYHDENGWHDSGLNSFFENNHIVLRDLVLWNNKLFYISTSNTLREVYYDENGWHDSGLNSFFENNPIVLRDLVVWNNKLFYISTSNTLREVYFDENGWHDSGLNCSLEENDHLNGGLTLWEEKIVYQSIFSTLRNVSYGTECYLGDNLNKSELFHPKTEVGSSDILNNTESNKLQIRIYPNPGSTRLFVEGDTKILRIFNSAGQIVHLNSVSKLNDSTIVVNIEDWADGLYMIVTEFGGVKFIKQ